MALPAQIERDIKEIEELEKRMTTPEAVEPEDTVPDPEPKAELDNAEPEQEPASQPPAQEQKAPAENFEQKYNTLRGKYDAEVPRLHQQVRDLQAEMQALKEAQKAKPEPAPEPKRYVTDEDKETFGADLLDVQRRVAMEVGAAYEGQINKLEQHIQALEARLSETGGQIGQVSFETRLRQTVADFDAVNRDPRWVAWLNEHDPILRGPRREAAQRAFNEGDVEAIADYVALFKATLEPQQQEKQSDRKVELERQVTPSRSASATQAPAQQPGPKAYTEAQANKVWDKVMELSKAGRYDEAAKLEAEITAAYTEGRVRPR
jgi:hypothetical protein